MRTLRAAFATLLGLVGSLISGEPVSPDAGIVTGTQYGANREPPLPVPVIPPHQHQWDDWMASKIGSDGKPRQYRFCRICSASQYRPA
ncbi:MAG: hypothetical protein ACRD3T_14480 [Terriglobia bacterium]